MECKIYFVHVSTFRIVLDQYVLCVYLIKFDGKTCPIFVFFKYMTQFENLYQLLWFIDLHNLLA